MANSIAGFIGILFSSKAVENCRELKTESGLGVTTEVNCASTVGGTKNVLVMDGVSVIVGVRVIVGVNVMVGVKVRVGVRVTVGEGGKIV